ncbi:hypothetical protein EQ802_15210 [Enterobacter hormaechei]|nr:hypothetical protein EQ802_15210 [Enterobacter hormaechei]
MFAGKKSAQIREILISESAWEEMTCLFAPSLEKLNRDPELVAQMSKNALKTFVEKCDFVRTEEMLAMHIDNILKKK